MDMELLLRTKVIVKEFGPTVALNRVSLELERGCIHGLIGENGSGKSTLASIIAGVQQATSGKMFLNGDSYNPQSTIDANNHKVCMIVQEQGTFANMSVAANIFIGKENLFFDHGLINVRKMTSEARKMLDRIGAVHINEKAIAGTLVLEDRKLIEIARAMYTEPDILIVDESTTALSKKGREMLYGIIRDMKKNKKSVIFISHDIEEVMEICDSVSVLRDGHYVDKVEKSGFSENRIKTLMVGREIKGHFYRSDYTATHSKKIALQFENVAGSGVSGIDLVLHAGEILGIGGLTDCGMHTLGKIGFGLINPDIGRVIHGKGTLVKNPRSAMKSGMGYISKDRDRESLITASSIKDNICLPSLSKLSKGGVIPKSDERKFAEKWAGRLEVKMNGVDQYVMYLSGGNKQKVAIAKWLGFHAQTLILDCPTRGIDIGVKQGIYELMLDLKQQGCAILMISEELPELIGMCDRVVIMKRGKITGEFERSETLSENELIHHMI